MGEYEHIADYIDFSSMTDDSRLLLRDQYGELTAKKFREQVWQIAWWLHTHDLFDQPVGVLAEHQIDTICLYMGVLASGNYYVPIQPDMKVARLKKICRQADVHVILSGQETVSESWDQLEHVSVIGLQAICDAGYRCDPECEKRLAECRRQLPEHAPMYVIFTSGSTGEPKGIIKTHRALIVFLRAYMERFGFDESDRLASQTPFYFDASAKDIFLALKLRCELHILDARLFVAPLRLAEYLEQNQITVLQWVPSALCMLSRFRVFDEVALHTLKKVLFVGEPMPLDQLDIWRTALPHTEFHNLYGASEMAGICMSWQVSGMLRGRNALPIGYPLPCCDVFLVADGQLVTQEHVVGEIYVRGETLASGYLSDAVRSAEVFADSPCGELPAGIYYRSGDLAKYDEDGALVFVARCDDQIKHMGHRIELGEISGALAAETDVVEVCCIYEKQKIVLFYEGSLSAAQVRRSLKEKLSDYMLPNKVIRLDVFPHNANGKIDRQKLRDFFCK